MYLEELADQYHLIKTGGSDFHGSYTSKPCPIGAARTPQESIERLLQLRDQLRA